jgi:biopolymer transport protein ExbB/TolQ
MVRSIGFIGLILSFMLVTVAMAGTIYKWTDANGVRRYSNSQPPEGADDVKKVDEVIGDDTHSDQHRQAYDRMVEEANQEADRHFEEQAEKKARAREAEKQRQKEKHDQELDRERQQLQREIEAIRNRGLGPGFSTGQKEHLIKQIQEKLDQLDERPEN